MDNTEGRRRREIMGLLLITLVQGTIRKMTWEKNTKKM
jgi:hypothetical protein